MGKERSLGWLAATALWRQRASRQQGTKRNGERRAIASHREAQGFAKEIAPQTQGQWDAVRNGAAMLVESSNLLMMQTRVRDQGEWITAARRLAGAAEKALKAAESKDAAGVFAAGGEIDDVCSACHRRYAPQLNADPGAR